METLIVLVALVFVVIAVGAFLRGARIASQEEPRDNVIDLAEAKARRQRDAFIHSRMRSAVDLGRK